MKKEIAGQIPLSKLIFTHNWEDPRADETALQIKQGDRVVTITSGGCNTLGFLRFEPASIHCVDINPAQNHLMELKQAAIRRFAFDPFLQFMGIREHRNRIHLYRELQKDLSAEALTFWEQHQHIIRQGLVMAGRYEKFIKVAGRLIRILQGPRTTRSLFNIDSLDGQRSFFERSWNNRKWRFIFNTLFNKKRLAQRGLNADYFHFDDGSRSFSESFQKRAEHAFTELPARTNYFLALYLLGHYLDEVNVPAYLQAANFEVIKRNIDRIIPVTADTKYWLEKQPANQFDCFALSNICELMDLNDTSKLFSEVARTATPRARVIFRNLMIPREVPEEWAHVIRKEEILSREIQRNDRSFVYSKVAAYTVHL